MRPPGLEFAMGIALFAMVLIVFLILQAVVFFRAIIVRTPEFANSSFSTHWLDDPVFKARMTELAFNGDIVASEALWSGGICTALILLTVWLWKRGHMRNFLGLRMASLKQFLIWGGIFLLLAIAIEALSALSPSFSTDFMEKILGSTTSLTLLFIGVGLLGPLFEEFLLRGLLYGSIRHIADEHVSVALTAGVFTLMHQQYEPAVILLILPMGIVLGYARARTGSIWVPVVLHMLNNLTSLVVP
ncbi:MAG: CPBP family intramembrane glutamic endopeptidase [Flavobacteriales bacterium]